MATGRIGTTPVLTTRWSKAPAGGTTSLSGLDDNSVSLVYSVGFEQVYRNGVLLSRGNDYTATSGTSITLTDATIAGDIIEVFANATVALTDTYTQAQANGKFINNTLTTTTGDIIYASSANTPARLGIGSSGNVLTVSGGVPAWAAPAAASFVGCSLYKSAAQSIANLTNALVTFDSENFDTDGFHSTSTNTSRITIPSGKGGKYLVSGTLIWASNSTGQRAMKILKNNTSYYEWCEDDANSNGITGFSGSIVLDLVATDYIEMVASQNSGGSRNIDGGALNTRFDVVYLGA